MKVLLLMATVYGFSDVKSPQGYRCALVRIPDSLSPPCRSREGDKPELERAAGGIGLAPRRNACASPSVRSTSSLALAPTTTLRGSRFTCEQKARQHMTTANQPGFPWSLRFQNLHGVVLFVLIGAATLGCEKGRLRSEAMRAQAVRECLATCRTTCQEECRSKFPEECYDDDCEACECAAGCMSPSACILDRRTACLTGTAPKRNKKAVATIRTRSNGRTKVTHLYPRRLKLDTKHWCDIDGCNPCALDCQVKCIQACQTRCGDDFTCESLCNCDLNCSSEYPDDSCYTPQCTPCTCPSECNSDHKDTCVENCKADECSEQACQTKCAAD